MIQKEFEAFLELLTNAGAELIFVFKKCRIIDDEKETTKERPHENVERNQAKWLQVQEFMRQLEEIEYTQDLSNFFERNPCYSTVFDRDTGSTLYQSAMKYGKFRGNDLLLIKGSTGHMMIANEVGAHATIGLDTNYLFLEESCKFWFPESKRDMTMGSPVNFVLKQFDKEMIRNHFQMTIEQYRLMYVLVNLKEFNSSLDNMNALKKFFGGDYRWDAIANFIHEQVVFPLTQESIESIASMIFGTSDPEIVQEIQKSLDVLGPACHPNLVKYHDDEINQLIIDDPYQLAENILNNQIICVDSPFLKFDETDMQPLSTLVQPWIRRIMGMLLKDDNGPKTRRMRFQVAANRRDDILLEAELPTCMKSWTINDNSFILCLIFLVEVPPLKQLISGSITIEEKYKVLSFLIDDVINEDKLRQLPIAYLMHTIILVHLVKNNSLQAFEAEAFTKALKDVYDSNIPSALIYPEKVNVRAFRTSYLYGKMHHILASCFASIGLKDFIVSDNIIILLLSIKILFFSDRNRNGQRPISNLLPVNDERRTFE